MKAYDIRIFVFLGIAMIANAVMDAADFSAGGQELKFAWHFLKWIIFIPSVFIAGYNYFLGRFGWFFKKRHKAFFLAYLIFLWQVVYNLFRAFVFHNGVPWWF